MIGRGEFVRLMFEVAGVPFIDTATMHEGHKKVTPMVHSRGGNENTSMPAFAPPIIRKGTFVLC
jgi:hypothetical protein